VGVVRAHSRGERRREEEREERDGEGGERAGGEAHRANKVAKSLRWGVERLVQTRAQHGSALTANGRCFFFQ
jgi:hypothetical protein